MVEATTLAHTTSDTGGAKLRSSSGPLLLFTWYDLHPVNQCDLVRYRTLARSAGEVARRVSEHPYLQNRTAPQLLRNGSLKKAKPTPDVAGWVSGSIQWLDSDGTWHTLTSTAVET
jgi:hypothetical protein